MYSAGQISHSFACQYCNPDFGLVVSHQITTVIGTIVCNA